MTDINEITKKAAKPKVAKVSKAKTQQKDPAQPILVRWNLHELPSAQHKAGLAGLVLCVDALNRNGIANGVCAVEAIDEYGLTLRVDQGGMQSLFDDIYAASTEEQERKQQLKRKDKSVIEPKRTVEKTTTDDKGKEKTTTYYVYEQTVPKAALIEEWDSSSSGQSKLWVKLWRDLVWTTLRGVPATREPYDARAEKRVVADGAEVWDELANTPGKSVELPSTYYLGAQSSSAENVDFKDVARFRCLLHFWPFAVPIYVPSVLSRDGEREFSGYAIAVPDIRSLKSYVDDWPTMARERDCKPSGFRPKAAVIDVAAESALDLFCRMQALVARRLGPSVVAAAVNAVDVFHIEKEGNNVRMRYSGRIDLVHERANAYARIRDNYWSPIFRRQRVINLLDDREWSASFGRLCSVTTEALTIGSNQFQHDCKLAFTEVEMQTVSDDEEKKLEDYVYGAVRSYVISKLDQKYGLVWDKVKDNPKLKDEYSQKKEKVARGAFLAVRSRTGKDFVDYFTGTLCSVTQRVGQRGFQVLAKALFDEREVERVRSLTLLALSANA